MRTRGGGGLSASEVETLLERSDHRCQLTGLALTPEVAELDHKIPLSRGGDNSADNLMLVCSAVNRAKGTLTTEEFISLCQRVTEWVGRNGHSNRGANAVGPTEWDDGTIERAAS